MAGLLSTGSKGAVFAALVPLAAGLSGGWQELEAVLWLLAALSMLIGTLCALGQENLKRMLAYSSVVHMGYAVIALLAGGAAGRGALVFYLIAYGVVNLGAFGVLASFANEDEEPQTYEAWRGIGFRHPLRAAAMTLFLLSLAGIPPTVGFIGKFGIFYAAVEQGYIALALIGVLTSLVSLYYYLRPVVVMYMSDEEGRSLPAGGGHQHAALLACFAATLLLGLLPGPLLELIQTVIP